MGIKGRLPLVLVVDDFDDARDMYAEFLGAGGYAVTAAADGEQALQAAARQQFDVIILDIALPKLDGISVIRELRRRNDHTPVITLSASVNEETRDNAVQAGASLALEKPCLPDELAEAVRRTLQRRS